MKKVKIKYNPFRRKTEILVDEKPPKKNSSLNFGERRLQEWAGDLPSLLVKEYNDKNFSIEFTGTEADYEDLKTSFTSGVEANVNSWKHNRTPDVKEVEEQVDEIFDEINHGPVPELKDETIIQAFSKAKNQRFEINVVATMSSGKSTLINALLDKKLMPVANEATTATIVEIVDTDIDGFRGSARDKDGKEIAKNDNLTYAVMKDWNKNPDISTIIIEGRIPCVNSVGMRLVLVDTPGPNNSADTGHKALTYKMLSDSDKSLVLFVMRADALAVNDEKEFLDYVCDCMNKGGKQSRDRFIFAINKMDVFNPEEESVEGALNTIKENLEKRGLFEPNIFPVSAQAAFEARTRPTIEQTLSYYEKYVQYFPSTHFDNYYQFSHLPHLVSIELEKWLKEAKANPDKEEGKYTQIEIHSGIVSIEKAIELYINKYARTIKVFDLVQSFNNRLKKLAAIANLEQSIRDDKAKKKQIEANIETIKAKIKSGENAQELSALVDSTDIITSTDEQIQKYVDTQLNKINSIIWKHKNSTKVLRADAVKQAKAIENDNKDMPAQLEAQIDSILTTEYNSMFKQIIQKYESYVKDLGLNFDNSAMIINPLDFVAEKLADVSSIIAKNTETVDEGHNTKETVSYQEKVKRAWYNPARWFGDKYVYETRYKTIDKWIPNIVEYVDMHKVVSNFFQPLQSQLLKIKAQAKEHVETETSNIKSSLREQLSEINKALETKLNQLNQMINNANETAQQIATKQNNLKWMNGIIDRVNKLINF